MKRLMKQIIFLAVCTVPYAFLTMLGDFLLSRAGPPPPMGFFAALLGLAAIFALYSFIAVKAKLLPIMIAGNVLSYFISYWLILGYDAYAWEGFFKPFSPFIVLNIHTAVFLLVQAVVVHYFHFKKKHAHKAKE